MAKQLIIKDPSSDKTYTLEFTRKSVETMEKQGFIAADVERWRRTALLPPMWSASL